MKNIFGLNKMKKIFGLNKKPKFDMPNIKSTFVTTVEIKNFIPKVTLTAWSNRSIVQYIYAIYMLDDDLTEVEVKNATKKLQWDIIIEPCIQTDYDYTFNKVQREYLLVKLYELSRSRYIHGLEHNCKKCDAYSTQSIDLKKDFNIEPLSVLKLDIDDYTFVLSFDNDYHETYTTVENEDMADYLLRYIDAININGTEYKPLSKDEIVKWCFDELEEDIFFRLINELDKVIPSIEYKIKYKCIYCNFDNEIIYGDLPNF